MASALASKVVDEAEAEESRPVSKLKHLFEERKQRNVQLCCLRIDTDDNPVVEMEQADIAIKGRGDYERLGIVSFPAAPPGLPPTGFSRRSVLEACIAARASLIAPLRSAISLFPRLMARVNMHPFVTAVVCSAPVYFRDGEDKFYFPDGAVLDAFLFDAIGGPGTRIQEMFHNNTLALGFQLTQTVQFYSATVNPYDDPDRASVMYHMLTCTHANHPLYMNKLQIQATDSQLTKLTSLYRHIFTIAAPGQFASAHGLGDQPLHVGIFVDVTRKQDFRTRPLTVGMQYPLLEDMHQECQSSFLETAINTLVYEREHLSRIESESTTLLDLIEEQNYVLADHLSLPPPNLNSLAVMTYNVSWESLECTEAAKTCCPEMGVNECTTSIADTIASVLGAVDFVAMQEIRPDRDMQWPALALEIRKRLADPSILDTHYDPVFATPDDTSGIMLLYNRQRFVMRAQVVGDFLRPPPDLWGAIKDRLGATFSPLEREALEFDDAQLPQLPPLSETSGRPYQIVFFDGSYPVIVVNVHMPHKKEMRKVRIPNPPYVADLWNVHFEEIMTATIRIQLERKMADAYGDPRVSIVICGDFNRDPAPFINRFVGDRKPLAGPKDVVMTCCIPPDHIGSGASTYDRAFDHIYTTFGNTAFYKAVQQNAQIPASDHLPVVARFDRGEAETREAAGAEVDAAVEHFIFQGRGKGGSEPVEEDDLESLFVLQPMLRPILTVPIFREVFCNIMFPAMIPRHPDFKVHLSMNNLTYLFLCLSSALVDTKIPGAFLNKPSDESLFQKWKRMAALGLDSCDKYLRVSNPALRARLDSLPKYGVVPRFYRLMQSSSGSVNYYLRFLPHNYDVVDTRGAVGVLDTRSSSAKRVSKYLQIVLDPKLPHMTGVLSGEDIDLLLADDSYPGILPYTAPEFVMTNLTQRFVHIFFHYLFKTRPWITLTLYRGLQATPALPMPKVGELIREDGIMYTTFNNKHANMYLTRKNKAGSNTTPYLLRFADAHVPCTVNYGDLLVFNNDYTEFELVLPPGTVISINSMTEVAVDGTDKKLAVFDCTFVDLESAWVNQPYAPLADDTRGRLLYKDNDMTLERIAQEPKTKEAFSKMDALFEQLVGSAGIRSAINQCTEFIESLGTQWTTRLPNGYNIPITGPNVTHHHHAHMDLVSVTQSTNTPRTASEDEMFPASILINPRQAYMPLAKLRKRQVQTLVRLPSVEQKARAVRRRQRLASEAGEGTVSAAKTLRVRQIDEFLTPLRAGQEVTDLRRTGIVESLSPDGAVVQFVDPMGRLGDKETVPVRLLRIVHGSVSRQSFLIMFRFPKDSMDAASWELVKDRERWNALYTSHPNIVRAEIIGHPHMVMGILVIHGFVTRNEMVRTILDTFHMNLINPQPNPYMITDANLGLGVTGFTTRDPSRPTFEELKILSAQHSAAYTSRPMIITQDPKYYERWQDLKALITARRYIWILSGVKQNADSGLEPAEGSSSTQTKLSFA